MAGDVRHYGDGFWCDGRKKLKEHGKDDEVSEGNSGIKQDDTGDKDRDGQGSLILIQRRRNKCPYLVEQKRHGEEYGDEEGQFEWGEKRLGDIGDDHA